MALDELFDATTLPALRQAVLAEAVSAGLAGDRANDVVLAVHELAANAVRHGGGTGRVWMLASGATLHCQISDTGPGAGSAPAAGLVAGRPWPVQFGHGLWLVSRLADQVSLTPGLAGSEVTVAFALPDAGGQSKHQPSSGDRTAAEVTGRDR
jgi:anti-sigma regulatory factor (Ser/Thr protein kinase)